MAEIETLRPPALEPAERPIAFQGAPGAYSDLACRQAFPERLTLPSRSFEDALDSVRAGTAELAVIPIENSLIGRIADVHHLLPRSGLYIVGEHFVPVHHHLLALPGVRLGDLKYVRSQLPALSQCRATIRELGLTPIAAADTAGSAAELVKSGSRDTAVIASELAAEVYGLVSLRADIEDEAHNTTRFVILAPHEKIPPLSAGLTVTSLIFRVRNVPAALYKCMGGFATNGINMTRIESYMVGGRFAATEFWIDVEAHPDERRLSLALDELRFFSETVQLLGSYPGHPYRATANAER